MTIFTKAAAAVQRAVMRFVGAAASFSLLLLNRTRLDYARLVNGRSSAIVVACVNWIARTFPEAPVQVLERDAKGKETALADYPMVALLERPNAFYSGELLWRATLADWSITGNAYWLKVRDSRDSRVVELWWLPSKMVEPRWKDDGSEYISWYDYAPNGEAKPYLPSNIVHFRDGLDPDNTRKGLSALQSLLREIFTDDEAANFSASLLKNMGVPGVVISPDSDEVELTAQDAKDIKADYKEKFGGDNRGEPMVLSGRTKVQVLSFNPQQMDLKSLRRLPEERVSAVFGVPAIVAGLGAGLDRSTFANMSEAREMAYESNIVPNQRLFAAELKAQLLPDFATAAQLKRLRVAFDLSDVRVLQEDQNKLWTRVDTAVRGGWLRIDRAKEIVGETPEAGDKIYLRPMSALEVGPDAPELPEPEPVTTPLALPAPKEPDQDQAAKGLQDAESKSVRGDQRFILRLRREAMRLSAKMGSDLDGAFEQLAASVRITVRNGKANGHHEAKGETFDVELTGGEIVQVELPDNMTTSFRKIYESNFNLILLTTMGAVEDMLGVPVGVNLPDYRARELIRGWATRKGLADVSQQTREAVMQALAEGREAGDGAYALGMRIRGMVEGRAMYPGVYQEAHDRAIERGWGEEAASKAGDRAARQYRAETIARTETKTAQNNSSIEAYRASDVVEELKVWDGDDCGWTAHDDPDKADGKIVSFDEAAMYPLAHPRCLRNFGPVPRSSI